MDLAAKLSFLTDASSYPNATKSVRVRETHMSLVFLTDERVYKLKKPVCYPFLDYRTIESREHFCREEVRLNRRLAKEIYLGIVSLTVTPEGKLSLTDAGKTVDWLVEMVRLPEAAMLHNAVRAGTALEKQIVAVAEKLATFYATADGTVEGGKAYFRHLEEETEITSVHLRSANQHLHRRDLDWILDGFDQMFDKMKPELDARIAMGVIVEGHGDLRPEHVCLLKPPIIFDCLEFDQNMRFIDPYDEMNYLGEECLALGASWIGRILLDALDRKLNRRPSQNLLAMYGLFRMLLRARLAIDHLSDEVVKDPKKWIRKAHSYIDMGSDLLKSENQQIAD